MYLAPISWLRRWLSIGASLESIRALRPSTLGLAALNVARQELGAGELGGNNQGPSIDRYRAGQGGRGSWCAAFVSYCLETGAKGLGARCPVKRSHGARRLFRRCVAAGQPIRLEDVQPGDIVLWSRGPKGSWKGHIGIVSEVLADGRWHYIAGNEGPFPAVVAEKEGTKKPRLVGFARV